MIYNWQLPEWPNFNYDLSKVEDRIFDFAQKVGKINGVINLLPEDKRENALIETMVIEALKTSEIEGEYFSREEIMFSIKRNLGLEGEFKTIDKSAEGISELLVEVRKQISKPLSATMLFHWHDKLMKGTKGIGVGCWRKGTQPMQVISGTIGKEKIHFEAPPSSIVAAEMKKFIQWFNDTAPTGSLDIKAAPVRSAIAHLYFESIHPFEDGNGRIGRAISEKALAQGIGMPNTLSLSRTIEQDKKSYYLALKEAQQNNDLTNWISYFVNLILTSQEHTEEQIEFILKRSRFYTKHEGSLNHRQQKVILKILEAGPTGFEGGMSAKKYMSICKTSKATATRDLQDLVEKKIFKPIGGGRSVRYDLILN